MAGRWADTRPADVDRWLAATAVEWWIAGGWALDLWLGSATREHSDIEIGCFRVDLPALALGLVDWEVFTARDKQLAAYEASNPIPQPPFSLWVRRPRSDLWSFEILVEEREGQIWRYRRDPRVCLPVAALTIRSRDGHRVVAPEVQLLYKAKALRSKDTQDFDAVAPLLPIDRREWLRGALTIAHPGHPWIEQL